MIKKIFLKKINSITLAAFFIAFSSLISRFLGIFRDRILAGEFGAGAELDVYYAAFRIPDLVFNLLVLGALSAGFIPVFKSLIKDSGCEKKFCRGDDPNKKAWELASNILNILVIGLMVISVIGIFCAPELMRIVVPGFDNEQIRATSSLARIMFLSPLLLGISSIFGGIMQSFKRFFVYSLSPIMYNIGIIIGALFFADYWGVYGLAWGVVLGAFMHMAIQLPVAFRLGFCYRPIINFRDKHLREIGKMMWPRTITLAITQLNLLVITIFASSLAEGSLSVFNFANNLQSFPVGIFGVSFAIAAFPSFSELAFKPKKLVDNFSEVFRRILFFITPITVLIILLRAQIVRVVLGVGRFDWNDTIMTLETLSFFAVSLFAQATIPLLIRIFYARHNSKTPLFIGIAAAIVNIVGVWKFSSLYGVAGLALGFSLANIFNFLMLWIVLHEKFGDLDEARISRSVFKFITAGIFCAFAVQFSKYTVAAFVNMEKLWGVLTQGFVSGAMGIAVYCLVCYLLKNDEFIYFWKLIRMRLPWFKFTGRDHSEARGI